MLRMRLPAYVAVHRARTHGRLNRYGISHFGSAGQTRHIPSYALIRSFTRRARIDRL